MAPPALWTYPSSSKQHPSTMQQNNSGLPACCRTVTPITSMIKEPKSDSSAAYGLWNCLPHHCQSFLSLHLKPFILSCGQNNRNHHTRLKGGTQYIWRTQINFIIDTQFQQTLYLGSQEQYFLWLSPAWWKWKLKADSQLVEMQAACKLFVQHFLKVPLTSNAQGAATETSESWLAWLCKGKERSLGTQRIPHRWAAGNSHRECSHEIDKTS